MHRVQQPSNVAHAAAPRTAGYISIGHRRAVSCARRLVRHQFGRAAGTGQVRHGECLVVGQVRIHRVRAAGILGVPLLDHGARRCAHLPHFVPVATGEQRARPHGETVPAACQTARMHAGITAAVAFLVAVLWFDLMFDVQVWRHRAADTVPEEVLASIAGYYRRVTTDASPMSRLISLDMAVLLGLLVWQAARGGTAGWVSVVSFTLAAASIGLALGRVVPAAIRLGGRRDPSDAQSVLARSILRDHITFLILMVTLLVLQLAAG
jgi:hypothetical protein